VTIFSGRLNGFGETVIVDYGNKVMAQFSHLSSRAVKAGDAVQIGQTVGGVGSTGRSTGNHLDYRLNIGGSVRGGRIVGGKFVDPRGRKVQLGEGVGEAFANFETAEARRLKQEGDEAAEALKRLQTELGELTRRFNPAEAAAAEYADTLQRIARLAAPPSKGKAPLISAAQADDYRMRALAAEIGRQTQEDERRIQNFGANVREELDQSVEAYATAFRDDVNRAMERAGERGSEAFKVTVISAAGAFADLIGGKVGGALNRFLGMVQGTPERVAQFEFIGKAIGRAVSKEQPLGGISNAEKIGVQIGNAVATSLPYLAAAQSLSSMLGNENKKGGAKWGWLSPLGFAVAGSTLRGSATIDGPGTLTTRGNSASRISATSAAATDAQAAIARIAEALGATVTGLGSVSIGLRKGSYRVDPTGRGITKTGKGAIDFGKDAEAAVRAATLDLIRDGILGGLRAGTQRLLAGAKDLDTGLAKALKFEGVFVRLKEFTDPVGAAVDALNKRFEDLKRIFTEAGAAAEDFAKLEELYGLERADAIKSAGQSTISALKDLIEDLKTGDNGLSLRDRLANARATYDPLAADIRSGKTGDAAAFAEAARNMIDLQRQLSGSQQSYFDLHNEVIALSNQAIRAAGTGVPGAGLPSPFDRPGSIAPGGDMHVVGALDRLEQAVVGAITGTLDQTLNGQLNAVNRNLGHVITQLRDQQRPAEDRFRYVLDNF
jgi:hypothetical protein